MNFLTNSSHLEFPRLRENGIEFGFIGKLQGLKYDYRPDITDRASLERNLRAINSFTRDDGTPLNYSRRKGTGRRKRAEWGPLPHPSFQLPTFPSPRRAMDQIVEYKNDPGNDYTQTLLCFLQIFLVSNRYQTFYFADNNAHHFVFNADTAMRGSAIHPRQAIMQSLSAAKDTSHHFHQSAA